MNYSYYQMNYQKFWPSDLDLEVWPTILKNFYRIFHMYISCDKIFPWVQTFLT